MKKLLFFLAYRIKLFVCFLFLGEDLLLYEKIKFYGLKKIVLYGANELSARLICLLKKTNVKVLCVVDRRASEKTFELQRKQVSDVLPSEEFDAVIICSILKEREIYESLSLDVNVISLKRERF